MARLIVLCLLGLLHLTVVAPTSSAHANRAWRHCPQVVHRNGNSFLSTDIAARNMSCRAAYLAVKRFPNDVLNGELNHHPQGFRCTASGAGAQETELVCVRRAAAYRFITLSD